jgi:hypothetical protein
LPLKPEARPQRSSTFPASYATTNSRRDRRTHPCLLQPVGVAIFVLALLHAREWAPAAFSAFVLGPCCSPRVACSFRFFAGSGVFYSLPGSSYQRTARRPVRRSSARRKSCRGRRRTPPASSRACE